MCRAKTRATRCTWALLLLGILSLGVVASAADEKRLKIACSTTQVADFARITPIADEDLEREDDEKTASVHFLRFELTAEIAEAAEDLGGVADEAVTWRLSQAAEARNRAMRSQQEDKAEYDLGENGARINRGEREALNALLENISFSKPRR